MKINQSVLVFALLTCLALAACAPHYRAYVEVRPQTDGPNDAQEKTFSGGDLQKVESVVGRIATKWDLQRLPDTNNLAEAHERKGWRSLGEYVGPYPGGERANESAHRAYMIRLDVWLRDDRKVVSVWATDWRSVGESDRLGRLGSQLEGGLARAFPEATIDVEIRIAGWVAP